MVGRIHVALIALAALTLSNCRTIHDIDYVHASDLDKKGNYSEAFKDYKSVAEADGYDGQPAAQFRLAQMYLKGLGTTKNIPEALVLLKKVAQSEDRTWANLARYDLGEFYRTGLDGYIQRDLLVALRYYSTAAQAGYELARKRLNDLTVYPQVFVATHSDEFKNHDSDVAPAGLEKAYELFKEGSKDEAFKIFLWHARRGNAEAQAVVATYYKKGISIPPDSKRYLAWTYLAARGGDQHAQLELGLNYRLSNVLPHSDQTATEWFERAAQQKNADAINWLGVIHLHPHDGKDPAPGKAVEFFRVAHDLGSLDATVNLADCYLAGIGPIARDRNKAKALYMQAAEHGNLYARRRLLEDFSIAYGAKVQVATKAKKGEALEANTPPPKAEPRTKTSRPNAQAIENASRLSPVELYAKASSSVYTLIAFNDGNREASQGSGVAVGPLLLATNCHVIEGMHTIGTRRGGKTIVFRVVARNHGKDVCLLKASDPLLPVSETRAYKTLKIGEHVYAIGSPSSLQNTFSEGLISGLRSHKHVRYIQTSAAISPGSSGGGLFDANGRLIGLTTFKLKGGENLNFAVAIDELLPLIRTAHSGSADAIGH